MNALDRRDFMLRAARLVGGVSLLSPLGACSSVSQIFSAGREKRFFSDEQRARLDLICDAIIPATDTPGAVGAGVPELIDSMMADWASRATRAQYSAVLDDVDARAMAQFGAPLAKLTAEQRLQTVRLHDAAAIVAPDGAYRNFKELVMLGYYYSQPGATEELRYVAVPGAWRADVAFSEIGRTWAV